MPVPEVRVEVAWTSGYATPAASRVWTDVSQWVDVQDDGGIDISYGRSDERGTVDPSTVSLTFDNRDGRFTPGRTGSPYFPNVKKGKPIRVMVRYDGGTWFQRGLWYVDAWPLSFNDGTGYTSNVTITASSRRAQMERMIFAKSQLRETYMSTGPVAYWPMDEDESVTDLTGRQTFRDYTNRDTPRRDREALASFNPGGGPFPVLQDGSAGPTDEGSLVRFAAFTNPALIATNYAYVGAGSGIRFNTTTNSTFEALIRLQPLVSDNLEVSLLSVATANNEERINYFVATDPNLGWRIGVDRIFRDPETGEVRGRTATPWFPAGPPFDALRNSVFDGSVHHIGWCISANGTEMEYFVDGQYIEGLVFNPGFYFQRPFTQLLVGSNTYNCTLWAGHVAVHDRALTLPEIQARGAAARASTETLQQRVVRVTGRAGVPSAEVQTSPSIAAKPTSQPEVGRSGVEVLEELATSVSGVVHDDRNGNVVFRPRDSRYNPTVSFTLDAATQQVQGDLSAVLDDRYLVNRVEASRDGDDGSKMFDEPTSQADYGLYSTSVQMFTSSENEVAAYAGDQFARYAQPKPRVDQVSVDLVNVPTAVRDAALAADIGTCFRVSGLPSQAPSTLLSLFLEGYSETIGAAVHTLTMNTTPADETPVWVVGHSTLGAVQAGNTVAY